jgi:pyridoxal phosphate enzyme (YggS family)
VATTASVAARLDEVRARIRVACERASRDPAEVTLVGVTKTHPLDVVREAAAAGLEDLGENRVQEFVPKAEAAASAALGVRWHFVGHLQRNKVREVLPLTFALHSLDSERLVEEIERRWSLAAEGGAPPPVRCYLEVNVGREPQKHGVLPQDLGGLLKRAEASPAIEVAGLMTVAPQTSDPEGVRPVFRSLRQLVAAHGLSGPSMGGLSMGMTDDYEVAIEEGATIVRIGRAIFGDRP